MSSTSVVPFVVPLLLQSSVPFVPSSAVKNSVPFRLVSWLGALPSAPGLMSLTMVVTKLPVVPLVDQSSVPCVPSLAVK